MSIKNAMINGEAVPLIDASYDLGTWTRETTSGAINFLERPAVVLLKGTGQAVEDMLSVCAGGDDAVNAVSFSYEVEKGGAAAVKLDVSEASAAAIDYQRSRDGVGHATLKLMVRKMTLTLGQDELAFEYDARAA